jgi:hypothetical protein
MSDGRSARLDLGSRSTGDPSGIVRGPGRRVPLGSERRDWGPRNRARLAIPREQGDPSGRQFSAFGTASENGAISASKAEPPAVTIW